MTMQWTRIGLPVAAVGILAAACSSGGGTSSNAGTTSTGSSGVGSSATVGSASSTATIVVTRGHLTDHSGRTVYVWTADSGSSSTCAGACASAWPPVPSTGTPTAGDGATAAELSTISRPDGTSQLAYAGHPLYYFVGDKSSGAQNGQGSDSFGSRWWELDGSGAEITTPAGSAGAPSASASSSSGGYTY